PDETREQTQARVAQAIGDPAVELKPLEDIGFAKPSPISGPVNEAVHAAVRALWGEVPVSHAMGTGATDSRHLRAIGIQSYGLGASGWHTGSMYMGLLVRGLLQQCATLGSPGVDEMRWLKPVRGGDLLRGRVTITSVKPSSKHEGRGTVGTLGELFNEQGERVFLVRSAGIFARRPR